MTCKIDHDAEGAIPKFLCVHCNPRTPAKGSAVEVETPSDENYLGQLDRMERREKRRLRAEVKVWRSRLEAMARVRSDPRDIAKAEAALARVEQELYMVA